MEKQNLEAPQSPFFSVVITSYNREEFISECIESALSIERDDFEIVIVDDCSTDKTWDIIQTYSSSERIVRAYRNQSNIGQFPNRNKAAQLANGQFIQFLDSDDKILPNGLSQLYELITSHSWDICFFHPNVFFYNQTPEVLLRTQMLQFPILNCGPTGMTITKSLFEEIGGFRTKFGVAGDVDFNLRAISKSKKPGIHNHQYFFYRRHEGQAINQSIDYAIYPKQYVAEILKETPYFSRWETKAIKAAFARRYVVNMSNIEVRQQIANWRKELIQSFIQSCFLPIRFLPRRNSLRRINENTV